MSFTHRTAPSIIQTALFDDSQIAVFDDAHPSTPKAPIAHTNTQTGWSATYSPCTRFRYLLYRPLGGGGVRGRILWVMMNPSTATEFKNDPTIGKCMAYSKGWGFGEIEIVNTFALRSPKPQSLLEELKGGGNPVGEENDQYIIEAAKRAGMVLFGCGVPPFGKRAPTELRDRPRIVHELLKQHHDEIHCLAITKDGNPGHPLYLPIDLQPKPFNGWPAKVVTM